MVPANREIVRSGLNLAKEDELVEAIRPASEKLCQGLPIQRSRLMPMCPVRTHQHGQARAPGARRSLLHVSRAAADGVAERRRFPSGCCCCILMHRFSSQHSTSWGAWARPACSWHSPGMTRRTEKGPTPPGRAQGAPECTRSVHRP